MIGAAGGGGIFFFFYEEIIALSRVKTTQARPAFANCRLANAVGR